VAGSLDVEKSFELDEWSEERVELEKGMESWADRSILRESERTAQRARGAGSSSTELKVKEELGKRQIGWATNQACESILLGEPLFVSKPAAN